MADVTVANTSPALAGKTLACHDADGITTGIWGFVSQIALKAGVAGVQTWRVSVNAGGNLVLQADGTGGGLSMNTAGAAGFTGDLSEKNRLTPLGHWVDIAYSAALFSADANGTWTVPAPSVTNYSYALVGKTLMLTFYLAPTTITGTPSDLFVALPAGLTLARSVIGVGLGGDGVVRQPISLVGVQGGTRIALRRADNAAWNAGAGAFHLGTFIGQIT